MEKYSLRNRATQSKADIDYKAAMDNHYSCSSGSNLDKLNNFSRFVPRQALSLFLAKDEIFKKIINVHGNIVECGVFMGGGLFTWAQLAAIYEPVNHNRKIVGFDTFEGFPSVTIQDESEDWDEHKKEGAYSFRGYDELIESAKLYDLNRNIGHIPKIELVKGNALETIPAYMEGNQHFVVSLLYLDFDLYEPTKMALEWFLPRMPKGAVIVFDELNQKQWPGETLAVAEKFGLRSLEVRRFTYTPSISYAVI